MKSEMEQWLKIVSFIVTLLVSDAMSLESPLKCGPGFYAASENDTCSCDDNAFDTMLQCKSFDNGTVEAYISSQEYWIGNVSGVAVMGVATYIQRDSDHDRLYLPTEWKGLNEALCGGINRQGVLCGECKEGCGPASETHNFKCVKCDKKSELANWLLYIALEYLPLTIFFLILLFFDIKTTSGLGNAFVFFAQMVTTTFKIEDDSIFPLGTKNSIGLNALYKVPYNIWNLEFLSSYTQPYCLSPNFDSYAIISLNYAVALYPMILILTFSLLLHLYDRGCKPIAFLCSPLCRVLHWLENKMQSRRSIIGVFATFIVVSYTQFVNTAFTIMAPNQLYDHKGYIWRTVPFHNGDTTFSTPFMIFLLVFSCLVLVLLGLMLPLLLVSPSLIQFLHRRTKLKFLVRMVPGGKIQEFLLGFHGCYKDGNNYDNDLRWFSGVYLLLRVIFFATYAFTDTSMLQYTVMGVLCFFVILLIAMLQPFKRDRDNMANIAVLALLGMITVLQMFNVNRTDHGYEIALWVYAVQYILVVVPLLVVCGYYIHKYRRFCRSLGKYIRRKRRSFRHRSHSINTAYVTCDDDGDPISPLLVDHEKDLEDFFDFTERSGRLKTSREVTWMIPSTSDSNSSVFTRPVINYGSSDNC